MKIPLNWLKEYVKTKKSASEIASILTSIGHMQDGPILTVSGDTVIDIEVRQNRSDCLSIVGVARELSAFESIPLQFPSLSLKNEIPKKSDWNVTIDDSQLCYRFNSLKIENLTIAPSPDYMQKRLIVYGIEPINNIVDITNYVMVELGQPLHAFNFDSINKNIFVRRAKKNEKLHALNNTVYTVTQDDIVIADKNGILALAGVIGGTPSSVTEKTTQILLEAATYNHASIRRSSLRHRIRTEASLRLEKFLHPNLTQIALLRAAYLFKKIHPKCIIAGSNDCYPIIKNDIKIEFLYEKLYKLAGFKIPTEKTVQYLNNLEFEVSLQKNKCIITVPYFRTDVTISEDIIEEVLRMYGYNAIPSINPVGEVPKDIQSPLFVFEEQLRDILLHMGFDEHILEPLTIEKTSKHTPIKLENTLSNDKQILRTTLQYGLLKVLSTYKKHRKDVTCVFELGKIYFYDKKYQERSTLGILIHGENVQYHDAIGVITSLSTHIGRLVTDADYCIVPIDLNTFYIEVNIEALYKNKSISPVVISTVTPQIVLQDLSLISPRTVKIGEIMNTIKILDSRIMNISLGESPNIIDDNSQSIFFKLIFRNPDNSNISKDDIELIRNKILSYLKSTFSIALN